MVTELSCQCIVEKMWDLNDHPLLCMLLADHFRAMFTFLTVSLCVTKVSFECQRI